MLFGNNKKNAEYIVDVHCHIMPGIDDGSRDITETLEMLKIAQSEGITHMIATPHFKSGHRNASPQKVKELIQSVGKEAAAQGTDIKLYQGNEILFHDEMCEELDNGRISRINGTDYVLVEFMPSDPYQYIRNSIDEIIGEGYYPIIAHIERYACMVADIDNIREIKHMGAQIQVNASSITGSMGKDIKKFVHRLLKEELVDYVGTDAHRCEHSRIPKMKECTQLLYKKYDEAYVDSILYGNAFDRLLTDTNTLKENR